MSATHNLPAKRCLTNEEVAAIWRQAGELADPPPLMPLTELDKLRGTVDALRAEVERLTVRVAELEGRRDILPPPYGPPGMVAGL